MADKGGKVPKATVQLRILVQDAKTGEIIWLNRAQVSTSPFTTYADPDREALFATAIGLTVRSLVDSFVATLSSGRVVKIDREGLTITPKVPADSGLDAARARGAAYDAEKSAQEARDAVRQAEEAAGRAEKASGEARDASGKTEEILEKLNAK